MANFPQALLGIKAELQFAAGAAGWTDATTYVYQRNPVVITRGRQNESSTMAPSQATMTVNNRDGRWSIRNPVGAWYGQLVQSTPLRLSVPSSQVSIPCYLRQEIDDTTSQVTTPDSAPLQITTGTLSVRIDCKITDWVGNHVLMAKWGATAHAWALWTNGNGTVQFAFNDGTNDWSNGSQLPLPYFGQRIAIRADYNIGTGTVTFFTAPTMAGSWTQLGGVITNPVRAQNAGVGQTVQVGAGTTTLPGMFGEVYEAQILSTASLVADPVFTSQTPGASSFADAQSNTWTLAGQAELSGRLYRFHGELASLPKATDPSVTDVYSDATASGITRRQQQQQTPADSAMKRAIVRLPSNLNLAAYWPAEDGTTATQIGAGFGGHAMSNVGLTMASSTAFACSGAIPVMNGGTASAIVDPNSITWTDNVVRFLLSIPLGDDSAGNGAYICKITTTGTVALITLQYATGGTLTLRGFNGAGTQLFQQGMTVNYAGTGLVGTPSRISVELLHGGTAQVYAVSVGGNSQQLPTPGSWSGTMGGITSVAFGGGLAVSAMGHFSVQGVSDTITDVIRPLQAWNGETAGARFSRLCGEEGIACRIIGPPDISQPMGNQTQQTIVALLQEIETTDMGQMFEPRQVLGLGYATQRGLCNQPPFVTASFTGSQFMPAFNPASDDQLLINDVTMTGADGSTARQVLTTGALSTASPPAGAGRFDTSVTVNPQYDSQLPLLAGWFLHVRSVDDDRYKVIPFDMARTETPAAVPLLDIGSYVQLTNTPAWVPPGPVKQLCAGFTENLGPFAIWTIDVNGIPESPYEVAVIGDPVYGHLDTAGSTVGTTFNTVATSLSINTNGSLGPAWTTNAGDFPFDIIIGGEVMTVTNITGAGLSQTFTVIRSVNGVVKSHNVTEPVRLAHPMILAL